MEHTQGPIEPLSLSHTHTLTQTNLICVRSEDLGEVGWRGVERSGSG
jgi:hypothetical protein